MNTEILSANIRRYRSQKKLTQQELSERSGVSLPTIKNLERSIGVPRTNTLLALTRVLDCTLQELVKPIGELSSVRFRAESKLNRREQILAEVFTWLKNYAFVETLLADKKAWILRELAMARNSLTPIHYAQEARKTLGLQNDEPIHDICGLLEACGIKILGLSYASDAFNGLSVGPNDSGPAIVINTWPRISIEKQVFSTAHELGHLLMHQGDYHRDTHTEEPSCEKEADEFASYFLLPEQGFKREWDETAGLSFVDRVMKVKRIYHVSYKTVLYRLNQKGVADDSIWMHFQQRYEALYNRKLSFKEELVEERTEPFGLKSFDFQADRLSRLVRQAVEEEKISLSRAAEILHISTQHMMERVVEWEEFSSWSPP